LADPADTSCRRGAPAILALRVYFALAPCAPALGKPM